VVWKVKQFSQGPKFQLLIFMAQLSFVTLLGLNVTIFSQFYLARNMIALVSGGVAAMVAGGWRW
jgi:hypothetical protein